MGDKYVCRAPCFYLTKGVCHHIEHWKSVLDPLIRHPIQASQKQNVLKMILEIYGEMNRSRLVDLSKFPRSTVHDLLQGLVYNKVVTIRYKQKKTTGRPMTMYSLNKEKVIE